GFNTGIAKREICFKDRKNPVGAELLVGPRLADRVGRRGRDHAGDYRHAPLCGFDRGPHHRRALLAVEIGKLAGRAEWSQSMHALLDQVVAEPRQHALTDLAGRIDRGNEIGKDAVEISHAEGRYSGPAARGASTATQGTAAQRMA